jgi:hypothetical protein
MTILELTDTNLRKDSFLQRVINLIEGITGIDLDGAGVGRQENKIPTINTNSQEIHIGVHKNDWTSSSRTSIL